MKKFVWIAGAVLSSAILFGAGLLVGRQFPAHHYQELGNTSRLFDSTTGHVCETGPDSPPTPGSISVIPCNQDSTPPATSSPSGIISLPSLNGSIPPNGPIPPCNGK